MVPTAKTHVSSATVPARAVAPRPILAGRSRMGGGKRSNSPLVDALIKVTVHPADFARPEASSCTSWLSIDPEVVPKLLSMNNRRTSDVAASSRPCAAALALAELTDAGQALTAGCCCESLSTPTGTRWPKLAARFQACEARQRDDGRQERRHVIPEVFFYLKFGAGVVPGFPQSFQFPCPSVTPQLKVVGFPPYL